MYIDCKTKIFPVFTAIARKQNVTDTQPHTLNVTGPELVNINLQPS